MPSLSESASALHAISSETLDKAHKRTVSAKEYQMHGITCIEQTIEREVVRRATNLKNEWKNPDVVLHNLHVLTIIDVIKCIENINTLK